MKKKAKIVLMVLILCAVFGGCANIGKEEKQLLIKRTSYNENDEMTGWTEYEYDEEGNVIRANSYDENGEWLSKTKYTYDAVEIKEERTMSGYQTHEKIWDNDGKCLKYVIYNLGLDGTASEIQKSLYSYDEYGRINRIDSFLDGEIWLEEEYIYDDKNKVIKNVISYDENGEADLGERVEYSVEYICNDNGKILEEYLYLDEENPEELYSWKEYEYNAQENCIEIREFGGDGIVWSIWRCEYLYDNAGNAIHYRDIMDFTGEFFGGQFNHTGELVPDVPERGFYWESWASHWLKRSYDEYGNIRERITYDNDRNADYERYVNEYKTITVDKEKLTAKGERKSVKNSDKGKLEFMKKLKDCMENKNYEAISEVLETRDTMWNTIYFQNNQLVDELSDGEALIYSYGSGVYYGQVVNGKRQGQGVQWKDDTRWAKEYGNQYYYIDGEWRDNKGNGYCKIFYSLRAITKDKKPVYAYIEGNYTDSMEDGEMRVTWLGVDQSVCTDTYQACNGEIQGEFEKNDSGRYKIGEDEGGSGNVFWDASTTEKGFPRKIYDQID